jgi:lipopolysaccharide transport system permease protein
MDSRTSQGVTISPAHGGLGGALHECWEARELLYFLSLRDVKVRYKQTVLGIAWAVLQPLVQMVIFTLIFSRMAAVKTDTAYPVFAFAGLLGWQLFQSSLVHASDSVVSASNLLTKVYFPRLLIPLAAVVSALVDFAFSSVVLVGLMLYYRVPIGWPILCLPLFVLMAVLAALSVGIWFAALNAKYRDFRYVVPFLATAWMFLSPVAYPTAAFVKALPASIQWLYGLNPMVGVLDGFRWSLLGQAPASLHALAVSGAATLVLLFGGVAYFRRVEEVFADVV